MKTIEMHWNSVISTPGAKYCTGDISSMYLNRAWYGLRQGRKMAHDDLVKHLGKYGYVSAGLTDGLFVHKTRDISFTLVVDDFGIKYQQIEDVEHLIKAMREKHTFKVDYDAKQYVGIHLE